MKQVQALQEQLNRQSQVSSIAQALPVINQVKTISGDMIDPMEIAVHGWVSDVPADVQVTVGEDDNFGFGVAKEITTYDKDFTLIVGGLRPGIPHSYRVSAHQPDGESTTYGVTKWTSCAFQIATAEHC